MLISLNFRDLCDIIFKKKIRSIDNPNVFAISDLLDSQWSFKKGSNRVFSSPFFAPTERYVTLRLIEYDR